MTGRFLKRLFWLGMNTLPDYLAVNLLYFLHFRKLPKLKSPETLNEKIAWRKLYQRDPVFSVYADKIAVKPEIARLVGEQYIVETLWVGDDPAGIPFDTLEAPYVIKVNHSSGGCIFVRAKQEIDRAKIIRSLRQQLRFSHGRKFREWAYLGIRPRVMVERMIEMPDGDAPEDYKFYVYRGCVHFIQVDCDRFENHTLSFFDREWNRLPVTLKYPPIPHAVPAPPRLGEMIGIAERIGRFDFARVDLYSTPKGIFFGEVTFYSGAGCAVFVPGDWDRRFGEPWKIQP